MSEEIEKKKNVVENTVIASEEVADPIVDVEAVVVCSKKAAKVCEKVHVCDDSRPVLCVKQISSSIGCTESQYQSLKGLGLGKVGKKAILADNGCVRGLIRKVSHLVKVGCVNE